MKQNNVSIKNRKASFDYFFERDLVAGIQLLGTEIKAIRNGKVSLVDSFCYFSLGELFLKGVNISATEDSWTHDPLRERKLLLNRKELDKLERDLSQGMTIVVKKMFTNDRGLIKLEIALARGKKNYDKRSSLKEKEIKKEIQQL
jgi:SsrA-binding protein